MSERRGYEAVAEACKTSEKLGSELSRGPTAAPRLACLHELDPRHSLGTHCLGRTAHTWRFMQALTGGWVCWHFKS
jgi:hypothetical protein